MRGTVAAILGIFVMMQFRISGSIQIRGPVLETDEVDGVKGYLINGGDGLVLSCQSHENLLEPHWSSDSVGFNDTTNQIIRTCRDDEKADSIERECAEITIEAANNLDVGFYNCLSGGREVERIYLYVNETQRLKTRKNMYFHWSGLEYSTIVIPCRPSSPGVNTSLKGPPDVLTPGREVTFSLRQGFFIPNANSSSDSGLYICKYSYGKTLVKTLNQIQILHVPSPSEGHMIPLKPQLEVTYRRNQGKESLPGEQGDLLRFLVPGNTLRVRRGEKLRIFCNASLEHEGQILKINWFKNDAHVRDSSVVDQGKGSDVLGHNHIYSVLELSDASPRVEDPLGLYTCSVINRIGITNNRTFNLTYTRADVSPICRLSLPEQQKRDQSECFPIRVSCGRNANISLLIQDEHLLNDPPIYWISPSGEEYSSRSGSVKGNYKWYGPRSHASHNVILEIKSSSFKENHGKYEFFCGGIQREQVLSVCVEVLCDPTVSLKDSRSPNSYFQLHRDAEFNCIVQGNPLLGEMIEWKICTNGNCSTEVANNIIQERDYLMTSKYISKDISGSKSEISCSSCSTEVCVESSTTRIELVDYEPPLVSAFGPCTQFDDQDERCLKILDDEKRHSILYKYSMDSLAIVCAVKDRQRALNMTFDKEFQTNHSVQFIWLRESLTVQNNGTLLNCDNKLLTLRIIQSESPSPTGSNNMTNQTLEVNRGTNIFMDCSMSGNPIPVITWYKDGLTLNDSEVVGFLSHNQTNFFLHAHETSDGGMFRCVAENLAGSFEGFVIVKFNGVLKSLGSDRLTLGLIVIVIISFCILVLFVVIFVICSCRYQIVKDELTKAEIEHFLMGDLHSYDRFGTKTEDLIELLPYDESIEFPRHRLKICHQIGSGAFGRVMLAKAIGISPEEHASLVAVKMCKPPVSKSQLTSLMSEIKIMLHLGKHLNVVNLLGACTTDLNKRELWVIVEYCAYGNLQQYLHKHRKTFQVHGSSNHSSNYRNLNNNNNNSQEDSLVYATLLGNQEDTAGEDEFAMQETTFTSLPISTKSNDAYFEGVHNNTGMTSIDTSTYADFSSVTENGIRSRGGDESLYESRQPLGLRDLLSWAYQVARGMEHLMNKSVIHGDLAARNVLLSEHNVVKICDFGLARNMYAKSIYQKSGPGGLLPVKWMAIESLTHGIFSSRSDVWSYGILLWEIFSLGRCPYPGEEPDEDFRRRLESGVRMECPRLAPPEIKRVMVDCWKGEAELRPDFSELAEKIGEKIHSNEKEHYLMLNSIYVNENMEREEKYAELIQCASENPKENRSPTGAQEGTSSEPYGEMHFNPEYFESKSESPQL